MSFVRSAFSLAAMGFCVPSFAAGEPVQLEPVQITATKEPEAINDVPASISVVTAQDLKARGANDLRSALLLVAGVEGTPGGDNGPAGSVPAIWGLREQDAFLLVVDGVPWGGAFNPATPSIDLNGVERIEVLRGAAPVMFGTTSFNGVIHVIHYAAGKAPTTATALVGVPDNYGGSISGSLPSLGGWLQSAGATVEHRGERVDRKEFDRYNLFYRGAIDLGAGRFHVDGDLTRIPQTPGNVIFRNGSQFRDDLVPIEANHNPSDAKIDQNRGHIALGYDLNTGYGTWSSTAAYTRTLDKIIRGFLRDTADEPSDDGFDADGYTQKRQITDVYLDSHLTFKPVEQVQLTTGADYLYGKGKQGFNNFGYFVSLSGDDAPRGRDQHVDELGSSDDKRSFLGVYTQLDWKPLPKVDVLAGLRYNYTHERASGIAIANDEDQMEVDFDEADHRSKSRLSGTAGIAWHVLQFGRDSATLYTDYRNTYKPKAVDFGPEAEVEVSEPETANSYEIGLKGALLDGHFEYDLSVFRLDFKNLLTFDEDGGEIDGGKERFQGFEYEGRYLFTRDLKLSTAYSYHDSRFKELESDEGDVDGKRLELSPYHLAAVGLQYAPLTGLNASVVSNYTSQRFLDKENTAKAGGYTTIDASLGWQFNNRLGVHVNGYNLTDRRVPVTESELAETVSGASSYYLLPSRLVTASVEMRF